MWTCGKFTKNSYEESVKTETPNVYSLWMDVDIPVHNCVQEKMLGKSHTLSTKCAQVRNRVLHDLSTVFPHNDIGPFLQEKIMHLWLAYRLARRDTEPKQFFRAAYMWRFEKDADVTRDLITYQVGGIIPEYVREYVNHIQQKEKDHAVQAVQGTH